MKISRVTSAVLGTFITGCIVLDLILGESQTLSNDLNAVETKKGNHSQNQPHADAKSARMDVEPTDKTVDNSPTSSPDVHILDTPTPTTSPMTQHPSLPGTSSPTHAETVSETLPDDRPSGLRLVLIGDSITRYQYLSLAYFLKYGTWFLPGGELPNLVDERNFSSWNDFYTQTNSILAPYERCDCFHLEDQELVMTDNYENRYFHDANRDNMVVYLSALGHGIPMHGRWNASYATQASDSFPPFVHAKPETAQWSFLDWSDAILNYVKELGATHVMFNAGLSPNQFGDANMEANLTDAFHASNIQGIWRTTTYDINRDMGVDPEVRNVSKNMCRTTAQCINVAWTYKLRPEFWWDEIHFQEPVYRVINEELLERVGHKFPPDYVKQTKRSLFKLYIPAKSQSENTSEKKQCTSLDHSLNSLALQMANHSSAAFNKTKHVLSLYDSFYIDLSVPIFDSVKENIAHMLEGYGLKRTYLPGNNIKVEVSFFGRSDLHFNKPRIVIQAEQIMHQNEGFHTYLRNCFASPQCVVWDFSDHNYRTMRNWNLTDVDFREHVLLLPIMIQNRLDDLHLSVEENSTATELAVPILKPLAERQYDIVFFTRVDDGGSKRRNAVRKAIQTLHPEWNILVEQILDDRDVSNAYEDARICLNMHYYSNVSGGEYHRLSDFARKGCIPLSEKWSDQIGTDTYSTCGGVVFAREDELVSTAARLLDGINSTEAETSMADRVEWWKNDIAWPSLLAQVFSFS